MKHFTKTLFLTLVALLFSTASSLAQFGCGSAVVLSNGFTATGITTPGTGGVEDWNVNPTGTSINASYWDDDVYLFQYTAGASAEQISMTINSINSWNGIGIFDDCTGTTFSTELDAFGSTGSGVRTVSATIAAGNTVYIAVGQWGSPNDLNFDVTNFSASQCFLPTNGVASNITTTTADLGWTENGTATTWNIEWGAAGFTPTGTPTITGTTNNPESLTGLTTDTDYEFYVQADCGGSGTSNWAGPFSFTTLQACPDPSALTSTGITDVSAIIGWTENGSATSWNIEYGAGGFTPTGTPTITGTANNPETITGLTAETDYDVYVQADCGGSGSSNWIGPLSFTTSCAAVTPTYSEDFATYVPNCWTEATGVLTASTVLTGTSSSWGADGFANAGSTGAARMNIYTTNQDEWLISPSIDLTGGPFQLTYDVAATAFSGTAATTMDADDSLVVVISTDNGATWSDANILQLYTSGSEPSNTGDFTVIDLTAYTGTVKIGFYAHSSQNLTVDYNVYIDNFVVEPIPACAQVSAITGTNVTSTSLDLGWTENGTATTWNIEYGAAGFTPTGTPTVTGTTNNPEAISGLASNTAYDFYVQADCSGSTSAWTGPFTVTTPCGVFSPTYSEDFTTFLPDCWSEAEGILTASTVLTGTTSSWISDGFANSGSSGAARMNIYTTNQNEWLISPSIDLTGGPFQLKYDVAATSFSGTAATTMDADDSLAVVISTDDGATWSEANILQLYTSGSEPSNTGDLTIIDLTAYTGTVKIGFYAFSSQDLTVDYNVYIDNFVVEPIPACAQVSAITATNTTGTSLDLGWTENGTATTWNIEYGAAGFTPTGTPTITGTTNNPEAISGLTPVTGYDFYVQADCGGSTSAWTGPFSFTTPCAIYTPNYSESFPTYVPECWGEAKGFLTSSTVLTGTTSSWTSDGFANAGTTGAARLNIWTTNQNEWLISPSIDLTGGPFQLEYDIALTTFSGTVATTMDADDSLAVVISTDDGATWSNANILTTYTSGTEPSNTGAREYIDLSAYTGVVKFGFYGTSTLNLTVDNNIFIDSFVVKSLCLPVYGTDTQVACDTYDWIDGNTYTSSNNTATHTLVSAAGCDSIVTLDLTINNSETATDVQTSCGPYTWIDGNTYSANNNTATFTLQTVAGCDSVVTLDLSVFAPTTGTDVLVECDSVTWIDGVTYTADNNTAMFTLQTAAGCDSVVTLDLTILNSTSSTEVVSSCDSYVWAVDGMTYSATGMYTATIPNAAGCDSIITLDLTVNAATSSTETVESCGDYVWSADGNTYSTAGTYTATLTNAAGCDSVATLILTIATVSNVGVTVISVDATLMADLAPSTNVSYSWLDCDSGFTPIVGATAQSFTPSINGNYAVRIIEDGCVDTSACFTIDNVGLDNNKLASVSIVPNPTAEVVTLTFEGSEAKLTILDLNGKLMREMTVVSGDQVDMSAFENGVYLFTMHTDSFKTVERVVKQ